MHSAITRTEKTRTLPKRVIACPLATQARPTPPRLPRFRNGKSAGWHAACCFAPARRLSVAGAFDGYRRIHSDRKQWLADLDDLAAIHAKLRSQQADRAEGRALWAGFCPLHDQAARLRRPKRV